MSCLSCYKKWVNRVNRKPTGLLSLRGLPSFLSLVSLPTSVVVRLVQRVKNTSMKKLQNAVLILEKRNRTLLLAISLRFVRAKLQTLLKNTPGTREKWAISGHFEGIKLPENVKKRRYLAKIQSMN
jgi:hypothetical protein